MGTDEDASTRTVDALALLLLPPLDKLTERQVRGITCVWDEVPLTTGTAVDLGVRETSRAGAPASWYPRACRRCVHEAAYTALVQHVPGCTPCAKEATLNDCETGVALRHLMRGHRR